ncbi:hypothetical protein EDD18DRAFT_77232 [Armillaria luteobubalina]|uniref:DUF6535 domain-containing protein n=1 Tax=Armillaria luteobubalina TaxID=153913 RepID=A0AA39QA19_9AGAR|nr:hypothetical protein EDD18DRAFT_77232 [Armillaria luteobubalina]
MSSTHTIQNSDNDSHLLSSDGPSPLSQSRSRRNSHISQDPNPDVEKLRPPSPHRQRKTRCRTMSVERTEYINEGNDRSDDDQDINDDSDSSASDVSEGEEHSGTSHISQDRNPKVKKSTSPSRRRRHKTRRRIMGMERAEHISKGNNPFDYEQKFPEDKRGEELGPAARVWRTCLEESAASDGEMVEGWRDGLDVLLVFAGLFSAVVKTFVAQTSQSLQVNYGQVTALLLIELIDVQRSASNGSFVNNVPCSDLTFCPSMSNSWVNGLWFTSLSLSLSAALFAVLTKQWIHQYLSVPSGTPRDRCHVHQFHYMGLEQWGVGLIIGLLPVLLSASLAVFLVGLVVFIIPLRMSIAGVVGAITLMSFSAYIATNFLPVIYPSCPYKTPLSQYMFPIYVYIQQQIHGYSTARALRDAESVAVHNSADDMDVQALIWLINILSNPSMENIVIESTSALPLKSVDSFKRSIHHTNVGLACMQFLRPLLLEPDVSVHESKVDRLLRAALHLTFPPYIHDLPKPTKDRLSPTLYAMFLCIDPNCEEEIRELVMSNLMTSEDDVTALHLQPIIWALLFLEVHTLT